MAAHCHGNGPNHCCTFGGMVCPFLEEATVPGRRWACGLLRRFGSWGAVANSKAWWYVVFPLWRRAGLPAGQGCWDWPQYALAAGEPVGPWACCWGDC